MQKTYKVLILTDHNGHSVENSLYALAQAMRKHPACGQLDIATRANPQNQAFFNQCTSIELWVNTINENFKFTSDGQPFYQNLRRVLFSDYDVVWLRLPPPLSITFLSFLENSFPHQRIINAPKGINIAGSKAFLMQFATLCPPMQICKSVEDILEFKKRFPIVLKPFRAYGGKGIVRIEDSQVWMGNRQITLEQFIKTIKNTDIEYLGVKFLKNVSKGDKRIIVVNGVILGASLRLPAKNTWLCNVAMGGHSQRAEVETEETHIVNQINPRLSKMGIVMYGVDTLVDDDGKRVLSEINTTSIGGVPQMAAQTGKPLVEESIRQIWNYLSQKA